MLVNLSLNLIYKYLDVKGNSESPSMDSNSSVANVAPKETKST